jgi:N-acetyl-anhydromuramyl-L-alanine amidase AmpD
MAKQVAKKNELPTVDEVPAVEVHADTAVEVKSDPTLEIEWKTIRVPVYKGKPLHMSKVKRMDIRNISAKQKQALNGLYYALESRGDILHSGYPCRTMGQAVLWLLEQLAD